MIFEDVKEKSLIVLSFMENVSSMVVKFFSILIGICSVQEDPMGKNMVNLNLLSQKSHLGIGQVASCLKKLQELHFLDMEGEKGSRKFWLLPASPQVLDDYQNLLTNLSNWNNDVVENARQFSFMQLRRSTLDIIDYWNQTIKKPRVTVPAEDSPGVYKCLRVHYHIEKFLGKMYKENINPVLVKSAIKRYLDDIAVPEFVRKKLSLMLFLQNDFAQGYPPSLCRAYATDQVPFQHKTKLVRPVLRAQGIFLSLKVGFIRAFCAGNNDACDEHRETLLMIAANNLHDEIQKWKPFLNGRKNSSDWANYAIDCIQELHAKQPADGKKKFYDPFSTVSQQWFISRAMPAYLQRWDIKALAGMPKGST
jgi:hypothetical protein